MIAGNDIRVRLTAAGGEYALNMPMEWALQAGALERLELVVDCYPVVTVPLTPEVLHLLRRRRTWRDRWWTIERQFWRARRWLRRRIC